MSYIGNTLGPNGENYGRSGAVQPISALPSQTAASDGTITFTFPHVALGQVWTGTINVASAPDSANFTAGTGATTFGQFKGSNSWGPVQLGGGDQLVVTGTGLVPGANYQCSFQGAAVTGADPGIIYPSAYADTVTTSTEQIPIGTQTVKPPASTTTTYTFTVQLAPSYRSAYLQLVNASTTTAGAGVTFIIASIIGTQSGIYYPPTVITTYGSSPGGPTQQAYYRVPISTQLDTSITFSVRITTGTVVPTINAYWGADLATLDIGVSQEGSWNVTVDNALGNPVEVYEVGGLLNTGVNLNSTTTTNILAAPAAGMAYRIHSISIFGATAAETVRFAVGSVPIATLIIGQAPQAMTLNGLLSTTNVTVTASAATSIFAYITYDLITTPTPN